MRWITDREDAERTLADARECAASDDANSADPGLVRLTFEDIEVMAAGFFSLPKKLMVLSDEPTFRYIVLKPDPVTYFFVHFGKYSIIEFSREDSQESYTAALNEDPGGSPADALIFNWSEYVILSSSKKWFIHGVRTDRSGTGARLFVPGAWVNEVKSVKSHFHTDEETMDQPRTQ